MSIPCIIRVLVVDNDPGTRNQVAKILKGAGCYVQVADGQGVELENAAKAMAVDFRPHVVIMDLRLSDEHADDRSGLELWKDEAFSSARCILHSAYLIQNYKITREALSQARVENVVGKEEHPQVLIDAVRSAARKNCGCQNELSLIWPSPWNEAIIVKCLHKDSDNLPSDLVIDVFGRLFPETKSLILKALEGTIKSSIAVARGRAILFQAWPDDREPVVVKLAPRERIEEETSAYKEFIQDRLGGRFYAELQKSALFWDLGGICYTFMGYYKKSFETFAAFYAQQKDPEEIIRPLDHFFVEVWGRRYIETCKPMIGSLFNAYDSYLNLRERLESFPIHEKMITFPGLPGKYLNPAVWIKDHENDSHTPSAYQAITHGDLHGDNLFVENNRAWAIDFERSGMGHILRDFVELEGDILIRLVELPENDLRLFYQMVIALTKPISPDETVVPSEYFVKDKEAKKALEVINGLRSIAHKVTVYKDMHEYYWGLLLDVFFSLKLIDTHSPKWWRGLLLSSLLCTRLKEWGKAWPPTGWLTIDKDQVGEFGELSGVEYESQHREVEGSVTNIYVQGNLTGNLVIGDGNQAIQDSYNKVSSADIKPELKETLKNLAMALDTMSRLLPKEQVEEVAEDFGKLAAEAIKPKPNKKWYSVSIEGLIKAAENLDKLGAPVINLSKKAWSLLVNG